MGSRKRRSVSLSSSGAEERVVEAPWPGSSEEEEEEEVDREEEEEDAAAADDRCIASRAALRHADSARSSARSSGRATDMRLPASPSFQRLPRSWIGESGGRENASRRDQRASFSSEPNSSFSFFRR